MLVQRGGTQTGVPTPAPKRIPTPAGPCLEVEATAATKPLAEDAAVKDGATPKLQRVGNH